MILTEEQARQKWCPHARFQQSNLAGYTAGNETEGAKCQGSCCMSWRWDHSYFVSESKGGNYPADDSNLGKQRGYCGLAGKP